MALSAYLTVVGRRQGAIKGSVTQKGREDTILVHSFDVQIASPRDPVTGLPTGKRQHSPIVIQKEIDRSSPQLWNALVTNESFTTWVLRFWEHDSNGQEQQTYTITLTNANIASIHESMADNSVAANAGLPLSEQISFTYQKIEWLWTNPATTAQDDWASPVT